MKHSTISRRSFLRATACGTAATLLPAKPLMAASKSIRKGEIITGRKLNIAAIGCGGKGESDIGSMASENIVALCDVDFARGQRTFNRFPEAKRFRDYREMLTEMDEQIDGVTVSTPDHTHFPAAMMAIEMGKHVYVQKPLTHTVAEARLLTEAARKHKVVTQMGNQGHSNEGTRLMKEWVEAGVIGEVREVHVWTNRPIWPQNIQAPKEKMTPPATLDWNRWIGAAPFRDFHSSYMPFNWRGWWEWGCGAIGDMGCHTMDSNYWALSLGAPTHVSAEVDGGNDLSCPAGSVVTYDFPARGDMPPVTYKWFDGSRKPPRPEVLEAGRNLSGSGQILYGSKGVIMDGSDYCESPRLIPESAMQAFTRPPKTLERVPEGHYVNWLRGIKGEVEAPSSNFEHAGPLTEMALLGNVAVRAGVAFNWDSKKLRCDRPEAQAYIDKKYRIF
ncbi:MAG: Gfo/Idh/MocA family oxidoreductase [Verrucomicrobia bacterium]|nr:Gfo/Idh/MocA family oxidoreductase [Verrucomicrobiota bacterium]